ncbi:uncharacterized protein LOC141599152 [Silene latifolia]|uniref:uncharacterized protein LOC141599152 n=1 Tax=Silene latifolia TaxID=37657 RepID=UPI003D783E1B
MADDLPDAAFWLPSDFLTDDDILSDFDFSVSALENETSEDDDLRGFSSPQSTLFAFESKNSGSSLGSPVDKKKDYSDSATLDLLKKAAGEVAKMKVTTGTGFFDGSNSGERLFYPPQQPSPFFYGHYPSEIMCGPVAPQQQQQIKFPKKNKKNNGNNGTLGLPQSAWPPLPGKAQSQAQAQSESQPMMGPFIVLKRESVGTGVFLPRHVDSPVQPKNKSDGNATTKTDKGSEQRISKQAKTNQLDDIRLPPEWVY